MKYGVSSNTLLLTAGIVWLVAGINILRIGISCWITDTHYWLLKVCEASLIFLLFLHDFPQALPQACPAYHSR